MLKDPDKVILEKEGREEKKRRRENRKMAKTEAKSALKHFKSTIGKHNKPFYKKQQNERRLQGLKNAENRVTRRIVKNVLGNVVETTAQHHNERHTKKKLQKEQQKIQQAKTLATKQQVQKVVQNALQNARIYTNVMGMKGSYIKTSKGKRKIRTGKRGGKYIMMGGKKKYIK